MLGRQACAELYLMMETRAERTLNAFDFLAQLEDFLVVAEGGGVVERRFVYALQVDWVPVSHDAAFGQSEPEARVLSEHISAFEQALERGYLCNKQLDILFPSTSLHKKQLFGQSCKKV